MQYFYYECIFLNAQNNCTRFVTSTFKYTLKKTKIFRPSKVKQK